MGFSTRWPMRSVATLKGGRDPLASAHWVGFGWLQVLRADAPLHGNLEPQTDASATSLALCPFRKVALGSPVCLGLLTRLSQGQFSC